VARACSTEGFLHSLTRIREIALSSLHKTVHGVPKHTRRGIPVKKPSANARPGPAEVIFII
jgi:hypothetical protein